MGIDERKQLYSIAACPCAVVSLLLVILLPMSFQNVEYYEVAFFKRRTTGTISRDKVYGAGRHVIGPDAMFVKFPASEQTVEFKGMSVWTKTERLTEAQQGAAGTAINVDISFQYRLRPEELSDLYASGRSSYARPYATLRHASGKDESEPTAGGREMETVGTRSFLTP